MWLLIEENALPIIQTQAQPEEWIWTIVRSHITDIDIVIGKQLYLIQISKRHYMSFSLLLFTICWDDVSLGIIMYITWIYFHCLSIGKVISCNLTTISKNIQIQANEMRIQQFNIGKITNSMYNEHQYHLLLPAYRHIRLMWNCCEQNDSHKKEYIF